MRSPINNDGNSLDQPPKISKTWSRAFTFDERAGFSRASTFGGGGIFGRTVTDTIGLTYDTEEQWTQSLIGTYVHIQEKGVDGDVPLPGGFAREFRFWRVMFFAGFFGCVMGIIAVGFLNLADYTPKQWTQNNEFDNPDEYSYYDGHLSWIYVPVIAGFVCGLIRFLTDFPDQIAGIFKEIHHFHVDYKIAPTAVVISCISLAGGATLGPEQALGTMGGGLGSFVLQFIDFDEDDRKLIVLAGMSAAVGALFPSPILTVLMFYELGHPPKSNMESVTILAFAASVGFMVYYAILGYTWLEYFNTKSSYISLTWTYDNWQCLTGFIIGVVSACLSTTTMITLGLVKQIFLRFRKRLEARNKFLMYVLPPCIAGLIIGVINWALPLTVGNGNLVLAKIVEYGGNIPQQPTDGTSVPVADGSPQISTNLLIATGFARMFLLGVSMNSMGFIGGFIFPMITMAVIAGVVCYQQYSYLPYGLCIMCFMAGFPAGICPMPITLACLAIFMFSAGLYQTAPIFIACITSYTIVCGSGLMPALQARQAQQAQEEAEAKAAEEKGQTVAPKPSAVEKAALDSENALSLSKYLKEKNQAAPEMMEVGRPSS